MEIVQKIRVFCSSPGDVKSERMLLEGIVEEINRTIGRSKNYIIELLKWETVCYPSMGRPQDVITKQVGRYDIFVGIMWRRFGTPTGVAESGTEEEFKVAYATWKKTKTPHLLFYFCQRPFMPQSDEELIQLQKVLSFRKELEQLGLIWEYSDEQEFERLLRQHLISAANEIIEKARIVDRKPSSDGQESLINFKVREIEVRAVRFIPFYIGQPDIPRESSQYLGFSALIKHPLQILYFDDGFVVSILDEIVRCESVVDYLSKRRKAHLEILRSDSIVCRTLRECQTNQPEGSLMNNSPDLLCYVMSVYHVDNSEDVLTENNLKLMAEPSIIGITDDPNDLVADRELSSITFDPSLLERKEIFQVDAPNAKYYVTWSNVLVETKDQSEDAIINLIRIEVQLQKLWYKLFVFCECLDRIEGQLEKLTMHDFTQIKREVLRAKLEYSKFVQIDATGCDHLNRLRDKLIITSKITEVYNNFKAKATLINEMESLL